MREKSKIKQFLIATVIMTATPNILGAEELSLKCVKAKEALTALDTLVFKTPITEGQSTLEDLHKKQAALKAEKSIIESLQKMHKERREFYKKLNPRHKDSFYNKDIKESYTAIQKQLMSNNILASITAGIDVVLSNEMLFDKDKLKTKDLAVIKEFYEGNKDEEDWNSLHPDEKLFILAGDNPYSFFQRRCKELASDVSDDGRKYTQGCDNFIKIKKSTFGLAWKNDPQEVVEKVTNRFFKAFTDANGYEINKKGQYLSSGRSRGEKQVQNVTLEKILKEEIKPHHIDLPTLNTERVYLSKALNGLDEYSGDGYSNRTEQESLYSKFNVTNAKDSKTLMRDEAEPHKLRKLEKDYASATKCFTRELLSIPPSDSCKDKTKPLEKYFDGIKNLQAGNLKSGDEIIKQLKENKDLKKFNIKNLMANNKHDIACALEALSLNLNDQESKDKMNFLFDKVCKPEGSKVNPFVESSAGKYENTEELWNCLDNLNDDENYEGTNKKIAKIDEGLKANAKSIEAYTNSPESNKYNGIFKYAALIASKECSKESKQNFATCEGENHNLSKLTLGVPGESFVTNLNQLDWAMQGKERTEEFLTPISQECGAANEKYRKQKSAASQKASKVPMPSENLETIQSICSLIKGDLRSVIASVPSPKQKALLSKYKFKYNTSTGNMDSQERTSKTSMIGKSFLRTALPTAIGLGISEMGHRRMVPIQQQQAIYKKNYMYTMNNPEFWFGTNDLFSQGGYGLTGSPAYYDLSQ
ncbi:hypothetical protein A9Q84_02750 [Halobacteriovorax marinus]|uniref:Uncharacterized protein n=1 Tax=Halobacteriovorax marinus TaxID=97084 RepID=A0A1Y5FD08_9BACT|nr:hypothetical protein A9Q84_02750 [Halobacteriovorax marinus]